MSGSRDPSQKCKSLRLDEDPKAADSKAADLGGQQECESADPREADPHQFLPTNDKSSVPMWMT